MLIGDGYTLSFYDQKMNVVWSKDIHIHNHAVYSPDDDSALVQASHVLPGNLRADRLEVYNSEGKLTKSFNFLPKHQLWWKTKFDYDRRILPTKVAEEITHVESFYRIPRNSSHDPALREGNYVVADNMGAIYFFDSDLKNIVKKVPYGSFKFNSLRDVQVTPKGTLLFYNSGNSDFLGRQYTTLDEFDLATGKLVWTWPKEKNLELYSAYEGNLQILPNNNILFSMVLNERKGADRVEIPEDIAEPWMHVQGSHQAIEITRGGERVWSMISKDSDLSGKPNVVKRQNLSEYLKHKGRY
jgi:hypothetical protein